MNSSLKRASSRVAKLVRLLGSDKAGEREAAFEALNRTLDAAGCDLNDLGDAIELLADTADHDTPEAHVVTGLLLNAALTPWEFDFVVSIAGMVRRGAPLSERQRQCLHRIWQRRT